MYDREAVLGARALCQPRTHLWGVSLSTPITLAQASVYRFLGVGHGVWCGTRRLHVWVVGRPDGPDGRVWTGPRGRSAAPVASYLFENGGDPRLWLQQEQGSRKGWRRTVGPRTSPGMSRMLCLRRDGSVELCTMKATSVAKRQCTGSAGTRRVARTGGGDDDAGGSDNQKPASRARQYVQGGCKQINGDAAHLLRTRKVNVWAFSFVATSRGDGVACHYRENLSPQKNRWPPIVSLLVWQNGGRTHERDNTGRRRQLSRQ